MSKKVLIFKEAAVSLATLQTIITNVGYTYQEFLGSSFTVSTVTTIGTPKDIPLIILPVLNCTSDRLITIKTLNTLGYVICVGNTYNVATTDNSFCKVLGLNTEPNYKKDFPQSLSVPSNSFFEKSGYLSGTSFPYVNYSYDTLLKPSMSVAYTELAYDISNTAFLPMTLFKRGVITSKGFTLSAPVFFCSLLYTLHTSHQAVLQNMFLDIMWYSEINSGSLYKVTGKVMNSDNQPLIRKLNVHTESNGLLAGSGTSEADGTYKISVVKNEPVYVVCLPDEVNKKAQVLNNITPELNE